MLSVDALLDEITNARETPTTALAEAVLRTDEISPIFIAALNDAADRKPFTREEAQIVFYGMHILGAARDMRAFVPLMRVLRLSDDELEWLIGDAITVTLSRIVAGVFNGSAADLHAMIADRQVEPFVRGALFGALAFLAWDGRIDAGETRRFLERFDDERLAGTDDFSWYGWQEAVSLLGLRDLLPRVEAAFRDGRIPIEIMEFEDFVDELERAEGEPDSSDRFVDAELGYIDDIIEALAWNPGYEDEAELMEPFEDETPLLDYGSPGVPMINPYRDVGRNDPCPCGSGKKFKKCCLSA